MAGFDCSQPAGKQWHAAQLGLSLNVDLPIQFRPHEGNRSQMFGGMMSVKLDTVIFGGGVAGLWLLDELTCRGHAAVLLEAGRLGQGQTVASQGILHGGLKYTLQGLLTNSAAHIRDMPQVWRDCLAGEREPHLTNTTVRSPFCYLWRTDSVASRLGMIGAKFGLRVAPQNLADENRPAILANCPGTVARLEEQVISPAGLMADFANRNRGRILKIDAEHGLQFRMRNSVDVDAVVLQRNGTSLELTPRNIAFCAGAGNAALREQMGLSATAMQRRPLHMVMVRGNLPALNGHCVDGKKTRVTITSDIDSQNHTVWQVGGQIAEDGVAHSPGELIDHARREIAAVIPGIDLANTEWATYRVDRAEAVTKNGRRPDTIQILREGNIITAWPTKLVLAPRLAETIADALPAPSTDGTCDESALANWPAPEVALPPWETAEQWRRIDGDALAA